MLPSETGASEALSNPVLPVDNSMKRSTRKRKHVDYNEDTHDSKPAYSYNESDVPEKKQKGLAADIAKKPELSQAKKPARKTKKHNGNGGLELVDEEKRLKRFRAAPPQSYLEVKGRALTQRLTVLGRVRCDTEDTPEEKVSIAGSTGNLYTVHIKLVPSCDCPHAKKGNQCKHIIYVMLRVLKVAEPSCYQLALTSSELREVFANAPPIPQADAEADTSDGNRKPIEGECPICYTEFELESEAIIFCKAACGNNVHKECMASWTTACRGKPTCPYCRAAWIGDEFTGKVNLEGATQSEDGYVNIASQLGLSGERDYSTYHPYWVRQQNRRRRGRHWW